MDFIAPLNLLFSGLIGAVLLLYVLRLRRKEHLVSSTLLWHTALRDLQANTPWQRLRSSLLMWLQIILLAMLTLALMRPAIKMLAAGRQTTAIIIDASGSMEATDVSPSRFFRARAEATRLIDALSTGDQALLITAGAQTRVLAPLTADRNVLKRALSQAGTQDTSCNLREAVVLAASLLHGKKNPQIYVLGDGAVPPLTDVSVGNIGVQFVRIGTRCDNVAITAMDVRRGYGETANPNPQVFVAVSNYSDHEKTINLELSHDQNLAEVRPLTIAPRTARGPGVAMRLFDDLNFTHGLFGARFDEKDDLDSDNFAYADLPEQRRIRVLLVSDGNAFLERALNVLPAVDVVPVAPSAIAGAAAGAPYDVVVCDGVAPAGLPTANQLVFNAITDLSPVTLVGSVTQPGVADWDRKHPVSRYAPWNDIRFSTAMAVRLKPWGQSIVDAETTPLVVAGEQGGRRVVWCGFDLRDTDLPLRVAFPIFITNTLNWLTSNANGSGMQSTTHRAGDSVALDVPRGSHTVSITYPDRTVRRFAIADYPFIFSDTDHAGLYTATSGSGSDAWRQSFGIDVLNKAVSDLTPRDTIQIGPGKAIGGQSRARANREFLWGYIAFLCLALLALEWWVYHRGA